MARGWHYTKLSISSAPLLYFFRVCPLCYCSFFVVFVLFLFCFVFMLSLELCRCSSDLFTVPQTTYRISNHVYYWVWLRPDRLM